MPQLRRRGPKPPRPRGPRPRRSGNLTCDLAQAEHARKYLGKPSPGDHKKSISKIIKKERKQKRERNAPTESEPLPERTTRTQDFERIW